MPRFLVPLLAASISLSPRLLTEESGIAQMRGLALAPAPEVAEVYLPEKREWVSLGKDATYTSVHLWKEKFFAILTNERCVHLYHTHPAERRLGVLYQDPANVLPSGNDLSNMIYGSVYAANNHPDGEHEEYIVTSVGITRYSLTPKGLEHFTTHWRDAADYARQWAERQEGSLEELLKSANNEYIKVTLKKYESAR